MFLKKILNNLNTHIIFFFIILLFAISANFFANFYKIFSRSYDERFFFTYGHNCEKYSYGFIKKIKDEFLNENKNIEIINFAILPNVKSIFEDLKQDNDKKNLILLNYNNQSLVNFNINKKNYRLIFKHKECLYLKKIND